MPRASISGASLSSICSRFAGLATSLVRWSLLTTQEVRSVSAFSSTVYPCFFPSFRAQMVKGAWWHSAHCLFCFQARLSFARKLSPRLIVSLTVGTGSPAAAPIGRTIRVTMAESRRMANLQARVARIDKQVGGRWVRQQVDSTRPASWLPETGLVSASGGSAGSHKVTWRRWLTGVQQHQVNRGGYAMSHV